MSVVRGECFIVCVCAEGMMFFVWRYLGDIVVLSVFLVELRDAGDQFWKLLVELFGRAEVDNETKGFCYC